MLLAILFFFLSQTPINLFFLFSPFKENSLEKRATYFYIALSFLFNRYKPNLSFKSLKSMESSESASIKKSSAAKHIWSNSSMLIF